MKLFGITVPKGIEKLCQPALLYLFLTIISSTFYFLAMIKLNNDEDVLLDTVEKVTEDVNVEESKSGVSADNKDDINVITDYLHSDILKIKKVNSEDLDSNISEEEAVFDYDLIYFLIFPKIKLQKVQQ